MFGNVCLKVDYIIVQLIHIILVNILLMSRYELHNWLLLENNQSFQTLCSFPASHAWPRNYLVGLETGKMTGLQNCSG